MKTLVKSGLLLATLVLFAVNGWALTIEKDDLVLMKASDGAYPHYTLIDTGDDIVYRSFCVERKEYFSDGGVYKVDSVGDEAIGGGNLHAGETHGPNGGDLISQTSLWLYASFFEGLFDDVEDINAMMVQEAIWYAEAEYYTTYQETNFYNSYATLTARADGDFNVSGWEFLVVNLVDCKENPKQSQLVGAPVPEPGTLLLLGSGLLGLAYYRRRKS